MPNDTPNEGTARAQQAMLGIAALTPTYDGRSDAQRPHHPENLSRSASWAGLAGCTARRNADLRLIDAGTADVLRDIDLPAHLSH